MCGGTLNWLNVSLCKILYDDGEKELLNLVKERWELAGKAQASVKKVKYLCNFFEAYESLHLKFLMSWLGRTCNINICMYVELGYCMYTSSRCKEVIPKSIMQKHKHLLWIEHKVVSVWVL